MIRPMSTLQSPLVRMDLAETGYLSRPGAGRPYSTSIRELSAIGVLGDLRSASDARGERYPLAETRLIVTTINTGLQT